MRTFLKILLFFVFFTIAFVFIFQKDYVTFFDTIRSFFVSIGNAPSLHKQIYDLSLENESLRHTLTSLRNEKNNFSERFHYRKANVYSRYPSNDRSVVIIDVGAEDGILIGMPVEIKEGVLFGKVISVSRTQSEVETIFSPRWKSSVAIGEKSVKGSLRGSNIPTVELIPKDAGVRAGDTVVNLSPEFPMGDLIGSVRAISFSQGDVWQTADLDVPYDFHDVTSVGVLIDFP